MRTKEAKKNSNYKRSKATPRAPAARIYETRVNLIKKQELDQKPNAEAAAAEGNVKKTKEEEVKDINDERIDRLIIFLICSIHLFLFMHFMPHDISCNLDRVRLRLNKLNM